MRSEKANIIFGRHPIFEALNSGQEFEKLVFKSSAKGDIISDIKRTANNANIPIQLVPAPAFDSFLRKNRIHTEFNHQGVIGFVSAIKYYEIEDVLDQAYTKGETPLFLILDRVTDVRNFGAIARSALCFGVHGLVIPSKNSAQINDVAIKASAGALNELHICRVNSLEKSVEFLKLNGIQILASSLDSATDIGKANLAIPSAIIMGSEGKGVSKTLLEAADKNIKIPMSGNFDSLNVSVASAVILYECAKQRA